MQRRIIAASLALILSCASSVATLAQTSQARAAGAWDALESLSTGEKLIAQLKNGEMVEGKFVSVTETELMLYRGNLRIRLARADISRLYRMRGRSRANSALIGASIGGAAGAGGGAAASASSENGSSALIPLFSAIGAGLGALICVLAGNRQERILIYEDSASPPPTLAYSLRDSLASSP